MAFVVLFVNYYQHAMYFTVRLSDQLLLPLVARIICFPAHLLTICVHPHFLFWRAITQWLTWGEGSLIRHCLNNASLKIFYIDLSFCTCDALPWRLKQRIICVVAERTFCQVKTNQLSIYYCSCCYVKTADRDRRRAPRLLCCGSVFHGLHHRCTLL